MFLLLPHVLTASAGEGSPGGGRGPCCRRQGVSRPVPPPPRRKGALLPVSEQKKYLVYTCLHTFKRMISWVDGGEMNQGEVR